MTRPSTWMPQNNNVTGWNKEENIGIYSCNTLHNDAVKSPDLKFWRQRKAYLSSISETASTNLFWGYPLHNVRRERYGIIADDLSKLTFSSQWRHRGRSLSPYCFFAGVSFHCQVRCCIVHVMSRWWKVCCQPVCPRYSGDLSRKSYERECILWFIITSDVSTFKTSRVTINHEMREKVHKIFNILYTQQNYSIAVFPQQLAYCTL